MNHTQGSEVLSGVASAQKVTKWFTKLLTG